MFGDQNAPKRSGQAGRTATTNFYELPGNLPFVGSGVNAKTGTPLGGELARLLRTTHPLAVGAEFDEPNSLISVSQVLGRQAVDGRQQVADFIIDLLDIDKHHHVPPPTICNLVQTPSKWYVTTTYDLLAEKAAADAGIDYQSFTWQDLPAQEDIDRDVPHELYIVHLHGSVLHPDSLILDSKSYKNISNQGEVRQFLEALFHEFRVCFMGTSLDEQYLQAYLLSWRGTQVRHVLVNDEHGIDNATGGRGAILQGSHGVETEAFAANHWELLEGFTQYLVSRPTPSGASLLEQEPAGTPPDGLTSPGVPVEKVRYIRDWGPAWTRRALEDLAQHSEAEALRLQDELRADADPSTVTRLIREPPKWMADGSFRMWTAAARFAEQQGDWALAREAWEETSRREGADKVSCLVSAAVAADTAGDEQAGDKLMKEARALNPKHPRVLLQDVGLEDNVDQQLRLLEALWEQPGDIGALAHAHGALAYLMTGNLDEAERHVREARRIRPDLLQGRIVAQNVLIHRYRVALELGRRVDARALAEAKGECLSLRDELMGMHRWGESVRLLMLAADATALQWEMEEAGKLLLSATEEELNDKHGRVVLADAALRAQQYPTALKLMEGVPPENIAAMRATAVLHVGTEDEKREAMGQLDSIIEKGGDDVLRAALVRATRAGQFPELGWPEAAEEVLLTHNQTNAALASKAMWLRATGDGEAARAVLLPPTNDVRLMEVQMGLASLEGESDEAARIAVDLLALGPDNLTRVNCAEALYQVGDLSRARAEATVVADDPTASSFEKGLALYLLAGIAADKEHDYSRALSYFERWVDIEPDNERRVWGHLLALTRLTRHPEALELLKSSGVQPVTVGDARIAAEVYSHIADPVDALRRVLDVTERVPDDGLRRQLYLWALSRTADVGLPEDLAARVHLTDLEALGLQSVPLETLRLQAQRIHATREEVLKGISEGATPVMTLAAVERSDIGSVWMRLGARPYGFGFAQLDALDVEQAREALRYGFIVEPTALFAMADLDGEAGAKALASLSKGRITQAALDDLDAGVKVLISELPTMTRQQLGFDSASGEPVRIEWPNELVEADHRRANTMLELAQRFAVEPDPDPQSGDKIAALYEASSPTALRVLIATAAVALRASLPVFSDDRCVRLLLRDIGVPVFGTTALLQALCDRGELEQSDVWLAKAELRASGYMGVTPDDAELQAAVVAEVAR